MTDVKLTQVCFWHFHRKKSPLRRHHSQLAFPTDWSEDVVACFYYEIASSWLRTYAHLAIFHDVDWRARVACDTSLRYCAAHGIRTFSGRPTEGGHVTDRQTDRQTRCLVASHARARARQFNPICQVARAAKHHVTRPGCRRCGRPVRISLARTIKLVISV